MHQLMPDDVAARLSVPALLSVPTVARILDKSTRTVRRRIADGSIPAVIESGTVMVRADELRGYIENLERVGAEARRAARPRARAFDFLHE